MKMVKFSEVQLTESANKFFSGLAITILSSFLAIINERDCFAFVGFITLITMFCFGLSLISTSAYAGPWLKLKEE